MLHVPAWSYRLRIDWLARGGEPLLSPGMVGLSSCPGRPDSGLQLGPDLEVMREQQVGTVVSLVSDEEMRIYGVSGLGEALGAAGIRHVRFPMVDGHPPGDLGAAQALCRDLLRLSEEGHHVLIHCIGGWGRSGTIAAALLTHKGHDPDEAIALVRAARNPRCVETVAQEIFVRRYARAAQGGSP